MLRMIAVIAGITFVTACQSDVVGPGGDVAAVAAGTVSGQGGTQRVAGSVTGSAHLSVFAPPVPPGLALRNLTLTAVVAENGSVVGEWQIVAGGSILHGMVDCLTIAAGGASARLSGVIEFAAYTTFVAGTAFAMEVFDNGAGESGDADVTTQLRAFQNLPVSEGRSFCETGAVPHGVDLMPLPTEHGNFTIRVGA